MLGVMSVVFADGDAVDLDVEGAGPLGHVDEDPRRRVLGEEADIDLVHRGECLDRGAVHVALEHVVEVGARGLDAFFICSRTSSVWRSIGPWKISPVSGTKGGAPVT